MNATELFNVWICDRVVQQRFADPTPIIQGGARAKEFLENRLLEAFCAGVLAGARHEAARSREEKDARLIILLQKVIEDLRRGTANKR